MKLTVLLLGVLAFEAAALFVPVGSIQINTPQIAAISVGTLGMNFIGGVGQATAPVFRIEPGLGGGKLNLGVKTMVRFLYIPLSSAEFAGSVLRTWGDPWGVPPGQTYAGGEFRLGVNYFFISAGLYKHIAGDHEENLFSLGAGVGI